MTEVHPERLRVSDDERREVDARLHRAVGEGRLTLLEYEERSGQVWAARTRGELAAVTRDLPAAAAPPPVPRQVRRAAVLAAIRPRRRSVVRAVLAGALLLTVGGGVVDAVSDDGRLAVMSGAEVAVGADQEELDVTAVMGGAEVVVAGEGEDLEIDATTMWGGVDVVVAPPSADVDVPERRIDIDARALMGGVDVTVPEGTAVRVEGGMLMGGTSCEGCQPLGEDQSTVVVDARGAMGGVEVAFEPAAEIRAEIEGGGRSSDSDDDVDDEAVPAPADDAGDMS